MKTVISAKSDPERLLSSWEVGELLQVNPSSVNKWVSQGRIPAFRTPGGHRRIRVADLVRFLREHEMPIPRALSGGARRRLLVVDDDPRFLRSVARLLKSHRDRIDAQLVDNGIDALVLVGSFQPDVVLLDVLMPGLDGIEVCRRLKERPETRGIEVYVTSGELTPERERKALAAGATRCLSKPLDFKAFLANLIEAPSSASVQH